MSASGRSQQAHQHHNGHHGGQDGRQGVTERPGAPGDGSQRPEGTECAEPDDADDLATGGQDAHHDGEDGNGHEHADEQRLLVVGAELADGETLQGLRHQINGPVAYPNDGRGEIAIESAEQFSSAQAGGGGQQPGERALQNAGTRGG